MHAEPGKVLNTGYYLVFLVLVVFFMLTKDGNLSALLAV